MPAFITTSTNPRNGGEDATPATTKAQAAGHSTGELLRSHIFREDNVLFPLADQVLTAADQTALAQKFDQVEAEEIGPGVHEEYHQLAHRLAGK